MKRLLFIFIPLVIVLLIIGMYLVGRKVKKEVKPSVQNPHYWFLLHRKSQKEYFYRGEFGNVKKSTLLKTFLVKTGRGGQRPTPLPQLVGRKYWKIIEKLDTKDNPETAPYFLTLDVPGYDQWPFGPTPYTECDGQCDWVVPGKFGLHGVHADMSRLSTENEGSSGCIRHSDEAITYLYNTLDPKKEEIRYYIEDI